MTDSQPPMTVLPPGSHLWLYADDQDTEGERGADVVLAREVFPGNARDYVQVLTTTGYWERVTPTACLVIGGSA